MGRTQHVRFYSDLFWAYDVALGVFCKHLIDVAETSPEADGPWLSEIVQRWGTVTIWGITMDDNFRTVADVETFVGFAREACARLETRTSIPADEVESWVVLDNPPVELYARGHLQVATAPVVELGQAVIALVLGQLEEPPPGKLWFYGLPTGRRTLERPWPHPMPAEYVHERIEKFRVESDWRDSELRSIVDARSPEAFPFLEELLRNDDESSHFRVWSMHGLKLLDTEEAWKALSDARRLTFATDEEAAYSRWHLDRIVENARRKSTREASEDRFPPKGPEDIRHYFARVSAEYPEDPHWANGITMCDRWLSLIAADNVSQDEIDAFLKRLAEEQDPGTGWIDLGMQFRSWATKEGYGVRS